MSFDVQVVSRNPAQQPYLWLIAKTVAASWLKLHAQEMLFMSDTSCVDSRQNQDVAILFYALRWLASSPREPTVGRRSTATVCEPLRRVLALLSRSGGAKSVYGCPEP